MKITVVGQGRLGRSLVVLLERAGHQVRPWGREGQFPASDVTWLAVPEAQVQVAARRFQGPGVLLHASGSLPPDVLWPHRPAGSLHLAQTFPGPEVALPDLRGAAAVVDGDPEAVEAAVALARSLHMVPIHFGGDRGLYHGACAMAAGMVTVVVSAAREMALRAGLEPGQAAAVLEPLARQALTNALHQEARRALTGPFARGDEATIAAHRQTLARSAPHLLPLYDALGDRAREIVASAPGPGLPPS